MTAVDQRVQLHPPVFGDPSTPPRVQPGLRERRERERLHRRRLVLSDSAAVVVSTTAAAVLTTSSTLAGSFSAASAAIATASVWMIALSGFATRTPRVVSVGPLEFGRVITATGVAFGALAVAFEIVEPGGLRGQMLVALPLGLVTLSLTRWRWRAWLRRKRRQGAHVSRALVVGRRRDVERTLVHLRDSQGGYVVVALAVTDSDPERADLPVHRADSAEAVTIAARENRADTIVLASTSDNDPDFARSLAWELEGTATELIVTSRLGQVSGRRVSVSVDKGMPLVHIAIPTFDGAPHRLKRIVDVALAVPAAAAVAIMTPLIALLIAADSRGPVFFRQRRVGRDGREFTMLKFRSMVHGAEQELGGLVATNDAAGPLFKLREDPRVTRVGRFLRRYSIDELPQFFNVLRGTMSLVGPRPPLPSEVSNYEGHVFRRLLIKPGITGPWQVGGRSDLTWDDSVALDLSYVENWSIGLDLSLIWRTVAVIARPVGAY